MPIAEAKLARLPLWARQEIARLERDLAHARERIAGEPGSACDTFADPYSNPPRPLGEGCSVEFRLGPGERDAIRCRVERDWKGNACVDVMSSGNMYLSIEPRSANTCELKLVDR